MTTTPELDLPIQIWRDTPRNWVIQVHDYTTLRLLGRHPEFHATSFDQALVMLPAIMRVYLAPHSNRRHNMRVTRH